MPTIKEIWEHLRDTAKYSGMSFASVVQVAAEIEAIQVESKQEREDKRKTRQTTQFDERARLRRGFKQKHALTSQVWARVDKRFSGFEKRSSQVIRAFAYSCQLPYANGMSLIASHADHLDEPGALGLVLADVNAELDAKRNGNSAAHKPTLAERIADAIDFESSLSVLPNGYTWTEWLLKQNEVAAVLKRREALATQARHEGYAERDEELAEDARANNADALAKREAK